MPQAGSAKPSSRSICAPLPSALLRESLIEIRYQSWRAEKRRRVAPLGLVLKGGSWYLAGHVDGSVRTYRVARVLDCSVLDERFVRPADFDLATYWQAATIRLEAEMHPNDATVRLSPFGVKLLNALSQPYVQDTHPHRGGRRCRRLADRNRADRKNGMACGGRAAASWRGGGGAGAGRAARQDGRTHPGHGRTLPDGTRWLFRIERISANLAPRNIPETQFSPTRPQHAAGISLPWSSALSGQFDHCLRRPYYRRCGASRSRARGKG